MLTKEQALEFSKMILADQPECEEKFKFLQAHTEGGLYWPLLRCFIVGMDVKTVSDYMKEEKPEDKAAVDQWMLNELSIRLRDRDRVYQALVQLQEKVSVGNTEHERYDETLRELNKAKLDIKNLKQTIAAKDQMIRQLQDKLKNVPTVGTKVQEKTQLKEEKADQVKMKDNLQAGKLSLEAFKHDVLLNKEYTAEQRDYLLSLMEKGEKYSDISTIAEPTMSVDDMRRLYTLMKRQQTPEKPLVERIWEKLQGMRK